MALGLRPVLMSTVSRVSIAGLMRSAVPALLAIAAAAFTLDGVVGWVLPPESQGLE